MNYTVITLQEPIPVSKSFYEADLFKETALQVESVLAELDADTVVEVNYQTELRGKLVWHRYFAYACEFGKYMGDS